MNEWERLRRQAERYRDEYPPGTRVMLLHMGDDPYPVEDNTRGTVNLVDDMAQIHVNWDNGRSLAINPSEDMFRKLTDSEIAEEKMSSLDEAGSEPEMKMLGG